MGEMASPSRRAHVLGPRPSRRRTHNRRLPRGPADAEEGHEGSQGPQGPDWRPERSQGMAVCLASFLDWQRTKGYSERTVGNRSEYIAAFIAWCEERGVTRPVEVTRPILERYQRWLYHYRKENGQPLSFRSQYSRLSPLRVFFRYLAKQNLLLYNPASELELPKLEKRLPKHILSAAEAEKVINQADVGGTLGLRDRAILETLYSTGMPAERAHRAQALRPRRRPRHHHGQAGILLDESRRGLHAEPADPARAPGTARALWIGPSRCTGCAAGPRRINMSCDVPTGATPREAPRPGTPCAAKRAVDTGLRGEVRRGACASCRGQPCCRRRDGPRIRRRCGP